MVQTRIEEKIETIDQEIHGIKKEIGKLLAIEKTLNNISKNMERQNQLILRIMESAAQERTTMNERISELSIHTFSVKIIDEGEGSSRRESETNNEEKKPNEEGNNDRNKFKKVEMPIFNGDDLDSWLFCAERYFLIHKLTESEKITVSTISFEGPTLNWYRSQEEREKFVDWANMKGKGC